MARSDSGSYDGEVAEEKKLAVFKPGAKKEKKPDLKKQTDLAKAVAEKQKPVPPKQVAAKKPPKPVTRSTPAKKTAPKKAVQKKDPVKKEPVKKPTPEKQIKPVEPEKTTAQLESEIIDDLDFLSTQPEQVLSPTVSTQEPPPVKPKIFRNMDTKTEHVHGTAKVGHFPRKEVLITPDIKDSTDLDGVCDLGSRIIIVEVKHPIYPRILEALNSYIIDDTLRLQFIKKGSFYYSMFGESLEEIVTSFLRGTVKKIPSLGYKKKGITHKFLLSDLMYTRTHTAYYVVIDLLDVDSKIDRFILVNADVIFS